MFLPLAVIPAGNLRLPLPLAVIPEGNLRLPLPLAVIPAGNLRLPLPLAVIPAGNLRCSCHTSPLSTPTLKSNLPTLVIADANRLVDTRDKNLAVANLSSARRRGDCVNCPLYHLI